MATIKVNIYQDMSDSKTVGYQIDGETPIYPFDAEEDTLWSVDVIDIICRVRDRLVEETYPEFFSLIKSVYYNTETEEIVDVE